MVSFTGSAMARIPATCSSTPTKTTVAPSARSRSASIVSGSTSIPWSDRKPALPSRTRRSSTVPMTPLPVGESKSVTSGTFSPAVAAALTTATPRGCSDARSTPAARRRSSFSSSPAAGTIAVTEGFPSVRVPVLSTTRVSTFSITSSASAFLIRTPRPAPRPTPTMIDMGVASPSAQGQAMIRTETATIKRVGQAGFGPDAWPRRRTPRRR